MPVCQAKHQCGTCSVHGIDPLRQLHDRCRLRRSRIPVAQCSVPAASQQEPKLLQVLQVPDRGIVLGHCACLVGLQVPEQGLSAAASCTQ